MNKANAFTTLLIAIALPFNIASANIPDKLTHKKLLPQSSEHAIPQEARLQAQRIRNCINIDTKFAALIIEATDNLNSTISDVNDAIEVINAQGTHCPFTNVKKLTEPAHE